MQTIGYAEYLRLSAAKASFFRALRANFDLAEGQALFDM